MSRPLSSSRLVLGVATTALLALPASAQIIIGTSNYTTGEHYHVDLATGVSTPVLDAWVNTQGLMTDDIVGLTSDDANCRLYIAQTNGTGSFLYEWNYNDPAGPQLILTDPIDPVSGGTVRSEGIAFANGTLYALDEFGGGGAPEGIYSIDVGTGAANLEHAFLNPAGINIGGLSYNSANGLFYGTDDDAFMLWTFDIVTNMEVAAFPYPAGVTDIDACVINDAGTHAYLIEDNAAPIHELDLMTGTYNVMPVASPVVAAWTFSATAWAPNFDPTGGMCSGSIGSNYCMANANSTGGTGVMSAIGSNRAIDNDVTLTASGLPNTAFGFFVCSQTQGFVPNPAGSAGNLCLAGAIGRYVGAGQIQNSGGNGSFSLVIDLTQTPTPTGLVTVMPMETWNFQAWHRDSGAMGPTSNFTDALEIMFI